MMSSSSKDNYVITYMPPFIDQSTYHCVDGEYPPVGRAVVGLAEVGCK
jgi:hypothetical protein